MQVKELQPLGVKSPVRNKQLFGEWELIYPASGPKPGQIISVPDQVKHTQVVPLLYLSVPSS